MKCHLFWGFTFIQNLYKIIYIHLMVLSMGYIIKAKTLFLILFQCAIIIIYLVYRSPVQCFSTFFKLSEILFFITWWFGLHNYISNIKCTILCLLACPLNYSLMGYLSGGSYCYCHKQFNRNFSIFVCNSTCYCNCTLYGFILQTPLTGSQ